MRIVSVCSHEGDVVPRDPSSEIPASDTMNRVFRKLSARNVRPVLSSTRELTFTLQKVNKVQLRQIVRKYEIHLSFQ